MEFLENKSWRQFFYVLIGVFAAGLIGFFLPIGEDKWNFVFENMIWFPFDIIIITVFFFIKSSVKTMRK